MFKAEKGPNNDHRMAIDDILIKNSACGNPANCDFNNDYCSYFLNETSDFAWMLGTGRVVNTQLIDAVPEDNSVKNGKFPKRSYILETGKQIGHRNTIAVRKA